MKVWKVQRLGAALVAVALLASGATAAAATKHRASKKVVIGLSDPLSGTAAVYGEIGQGMVAYFKYANAHHLVPGYTIQGDVIDNQGTVTGGASSVRQLLGSNPLALEITTTSAFSGALSILRTKKTPVFAVSDGAIVGSANLASAFGLWTDYTTESFFDIKYLIDTMHLKDIGVVYDPAVNGPAGAQDPSFITKLGGTVAGDIAVPETITNYAPIVEQLKADGAQAVVMMTLIPATAGIAQAMASSGYNPKLIAYSGNMSSSLISTGQSAVNGLYVDNWFPPLTAKSGALNLFKTEVTRYVGASAVDTLTEAGWIGGSVIVAGMRKAIRGGKALTVKSFENGLGALNGQRVSLIVADYTKKKHTAIAGESSMTMYQVSGQSFVAVKP